MRCPSEIEEPVRRFTKRVNWVWTPPELGMIMMSVDGPYLASSRWGRILGGPISSSNVMMSIVSWFSNSTLGPLALWCLQNLLCKCQLLFGANIQWTITHIQWIWNDTIDVLTRIGSVNSSFIEFNWVYLRWVVRDYMSFRLLFILLLFKIE